MTPIEYFWNRVSKADDSGCWLWTGTVTAAGYGEIRIRQPRFRMYAHRFSHRIHGGADDECFILHSCDNPGCVNPDHLRSGTARDNANDAISRGRTATGDRNSARLYPKRRARGERVSVSVLRESDIPLIRSRCAAGEQFKAIARLFGVSSASIRNVYKRRTWRHVA